MIDIKKGIYKHYKGKEYKVLGIAKLEETLEDLVLYKPLYEQSLCDYWVRPITNFLEEVEIDGKKIPRFEFVSEKIERPKVGVGVFIIKDGKVLLGKRIGAHGENTFAFPGGHLEFNESWEDCAKRETTEEAGIEINNIRFFTTTNDIFEKENKHYNTIFVLADYISGKPEVKEPHKCLGWDWYNWDNLPTPLFKTIENLLKTGLNPFKK
ncbi:MAG: hypothetical protein COY69_02760 [Candidatus Magasanikbacteria bacterium CG_4_10_14_0_8_um_filter_32_14]|uniref:Nudix hydrolase domain-containing protein n=1 Tax=Candidatus Magasanikbacteria bacterium CG_4_10_14_0_8_um_filter_32_14 TaxID=1974640 RepID=A0A2M7R8Y5_9BACT|nr:MAG: hypothetical protein COY69_02760 [Candidatus Magasanikbacteria bacterium CG_4_10_14_0_8_um_filter_32_14]